MDKMNTEEIAKINEAYAIIADIPALYERAWVTLAESFAFETDYNNPLFTYKERIEHTWRGRSFIRPENVQESYFLNDSKRWRKLRCGIHKGWWCK